MDHVDELRWHLMRGVIVWLAAAITIFIFRSIKISEFVNSDKLAKSFEENYLRIKG